MELTVQLSDAGSRNPLHFRLFEQSDKGDRAENQDVLGHRRVGDFLCCVLADGAGGHRGGSVAAGLAVNAMLDLFSQTPTLKAAELAVMVRTVNMGVLTAQARDAELSDMHSTLCALILNLRSGEAMWVHVGDSRVYHFCSDQVLSRTRDHSIVQWMADNKTVQDMPSRNALYTALGEPAEELQVEVSVLTSVSAGDWFLLCSDGLWEHFTDAELVLLGSNLRNTEGCIEHMHQLALSRAAGRSDNLSSIVVFID